MKMFPSAEVSEDVDPSSNLTDWRYTITSEELYQIAKTTSLELIQQSQQKWIPYVRRREKNNDTSKLLIIPLLLTYLYVFTKL